MTRFVLVERIMGSRGQWVQHPGPAIAGLGAAQAYYWEALNAPRMARLLGHEDSAVAQLERKLRKLVSPQEAYQREIRRYARDDRARARANGGATVKAGL